MNNSIKSAQKEEQEKKETGTHQQLLKTRTILISGGVDEKMSKEVVSQILLLENDSASKPIHVFINSPGGEISSGFSIFDTLRFVTCPITTTVIGLAASMGSVLSLSADEGKRFAFPNSRIMIHQPLLGRAFGNISDLEIHSKELLKTKQHLIELYASKTGKTATKIKKDLDRDFWFSSKEALDYGLIDKVVTSRDDFVKLVK